MRGEYYLMLVTPGPWPPLSSPTQSWSGEESGKLLQLRLGGHWNPNLFISSSQPSWAARHSDLQTK